MTRQGETSRAALYAIASLALLGLAGGWLILLGGGFYHRAHRYSRETIFVTGAPATLMAAIMFGMAVLSVLALVRARSSSLLYQLLACSAILLPPAVFVLIGSLS